MISDTDLKDSLKDPVTFIKQRLYAALLPTVVTVEDHSPQHAGHPGAASGGHFSVTIVSSAFDGKTRIMRHRLVYQALSDAMQSGIHALSIKAYTPEEYG